MSDSIRKVEGWQLAQSVSVATPDSNTSPGSEWLASLRDAAVAAWDYNDGADRETIAGAPYDAAHGLTAENAGDAPYIVGTHMAWLTFVDLAAYQEDVSEFGETSDPADLMARSLHGIAERVIVHVFEQLESESSNDES